MKSENVTIGQRIAAHWVSDGKEHEGIIDGEVTLSDDYSCSIVPVKWDNGEHTCEDVNALIPL